MPARFVVSRDGIVEYADISAEYTRRCDPTELFRSLARFAHTHALIFGAFQLQIPEGVSVRPGMPDAGFIAAVAVAQ
jgi:hypothetical protein